MGDLFNTRRRKVGAAALLVALLLMAGWIRSLEISDTVGAMRHGNAFYVMSVAGRIYVFRWQQTWMRNESIAWTTGKVSTSSPFDPMIGIRDETWRWDWAGFHYGLAKLDSLSPWQSYTVPYWSIILPLTLLSAYFLITEPRASKRKTIVEDRIPE